MATTMHTMHTDKPKITPKDFFLWAGAMVALYWSIFSLIQLLFTYADYAFPDALNAYMDPYSSSMRFYIASLIVLYPLFLVLMRFIRRDQERDPSRTEIWVRRWALVFTIFVAGITVAGDLITLINYFLGGEVTTRFLFKVAVVLLISGGALLHFLADLRGYWIKNPHYARMVGWGAGVVIIASIISGFFIIGSPNQVRLYRFDDQKVNDLQNIQYQIINYWQTKQQLPASINDLNDPLQNYIVPTDPQGGASYVYEPMTSTTFQLCATFNAPTQPNSHYTQARTIPMPAPASAPYASGTPVKGVDIAALPWTHDAGYQCFTRTIDPQRYPPFIKPTAK